MNGQKSPPSLSCYSSGGMNTVEVVEVLAGHVEETKQEKVLRAPMTSP